MDAMAEFVERQSHRAVLYLEIDRTAEARAIFEPAVDQLAGLRRDMQWLRCMSQLAYVCARVGDQGRAAVLADHLAPYAGQVVATGVTWFGAVDHHLGSLAAVGGRFDDAAAHFAAAEALHQRIGAPTWLARTRLEWARHAAAPGGPGRRRAGPDPARPGPGRRRSSSGWAESNVTSPSSPPGDRELRRSSDRERPDDLVPFRTAVRAWFRISLQTFGGPAGQIAVMHRTLVDELRWVGERRFLHALNYCMLLPGPEAQQLAIYLGWLLNGGSVGSSPVSSSCCPDSSRSWALSAALRRLRRHPRPRGAVRRGRTGRPRHRRVRGGPGRHAGRCATGSSSPSPWPRSSPGAVPPAVPPRRRRRRPGSGFDRRPDLARRASRPEVTAPHVEEADPAGHQRRRLSTAPRLVATSRASILAIGAVVWAVPIVLVAARLRARQRLRRPGRLLLRARPWSPSGAPTPCWPTSPSGPSTPTAGWLPGRWCGAWPWPRPLRGRSSRSSSSSPSWAPTASPVRSTPGSPPSWPPAW